MRKRSGPPRMIVTVNENGFIVSSRKSRTASRNQNTPMKTLINVTCPICHKQVREDRLAEHRRNAHPPEDAHLPSFIKQHQESESGKRQTDNSSSQNNRPATQPQKQAHTTLPVPALIPCAYCNAPVSPKNMAKHLRKVHHVESAVRQPAPAQKVVSRKPSVIRLPSMDAHYVRCSECKQPIHQDRLQAHQRKVHGIWLKRGERNHFRKVNRRTRSQSARASASDKLSRQQLEQGSDEPFDGGKHWGHIERENGRFGSSPLYDDYGEESSP